MMRRNVFRESLMIGFQPGNRQRGMLVLTGRMWQTEGTSPVGTAEKATAMKTKFLVVYEVGENNLGGFLPDVPGVVSTAATLKQMRQVMREAVEFHLEGLAADGDPIPEPTTTSCPALWNGWRSRFRNINRWREKSGSLDSD